MTEAPTWTSVCPLEAVPRDGAVAVLLGSDQVAVVRLADDTLYAVSHRDPVGGANVMARGIVGSATVDGVDVPTLTGPLFKQAYDLRDGRCLTERRAGLATWEVRLHDGYVEIGSRQETAPDDPGVES